ncbi:MAG: hypothetical protein M1358_25545 [Chloroflexi bacterium]|nr:hypothetical protein [Chloroflexota bacterium]
MWYFARVEPIAGMEETLRTELMWGESPLPKSMIGWVAADARSAYVLFDCHCDPALSGELEDLRKYFKVVELSSAAPFFIGEHAPSAFCGSEPGVLATLIHRRELNAA